MDTRRVFSHGSLCHVYYLLPSVFRTSFNGCKQVAVGFSMTPETSSGRLLLSDDGELLDGRFCSRCGEISSRDGIVCEHCGTPFPIPTTALRLRLEALRRYEGKKKGQDEVQPNQSGLNFIL